MTKFKRYVYPLSDGKGRLYQGSYTIKENVKPLGFKGEKLAQEFEAKIK